MNTILSFVKDSVNELKLVTWPTQQRLLQLTVITVIFCFISAILLGLIDFGFTRAYQWLLSLSA